MENRDVLVQLAGRPVPGAQLRGGEVYELPATYILFPFVTCPGLLTVTFKVVLAPQVPFHPVHLFRNNFIKL